MSNESKLITASDEQLVAATLHGDVASFGTIVERYWKMAIAIALNKINDATAAEDVAQESFIKAYSQLRKLRNRSRFSGWLARIVAQQCVNYARKNAQSQKIINFETSTLEAIDHGLAFSRNPGLTENQVLLVRQTINRLPDKFKELIIMRFVGKLSSADIARQLGKRHGTVRVGLHRAYRILRKELAPLLEEAK